MAGRACSTAVLHADTAPVPGRALWRGDPGDATMSSAAPQPFRGLEKNRLEALIDGIFAVALTLLVLDIRLPENIPVHTNAELWSQLLALERHFVIYVISFAVIGMYWINHHIQFHYIVQTNRILIWLNLLYLLLISFLPFATDLVGDHEHLVLPCEIYGFTLLLISIVEYVHIGYLARHEWLASPQLTPARVRLVKRRLLIYGAVPLASMSLAFFNTHLALYAYVLLAATLFLPASIDVQFAKEST